jgi:hypothetical protein
MSFVERMNRDYESGRVSAHEAVCAVIASLDVAGSKDQLAQLSEELTGALSQFTGTYQESARSTVRRFPNREQVEWAKEWLAER